MVKTMRKVRVGSVVRTRMDKTAVVQLVWKQRHRLYRKQVRRVARYHVHDPLSQCQLGDVVRIEETRPISKTKRWRLLEILERRRVAEVRPIELEADAEVAFAAPPSAEEEDSVRSDATVDEAESDDVAVVAESDEPDEDAALDAEAPDEDDAAGDGEAPDEDEAAVDEEDKE